MLETLKECRKNPHFIEFLEVWHCMYLMAHVLKACAQIPSIGKTQISSFLILPVQRIPRYEMLLGVTRREGVRHSNWPQDLLKHTVKAHPDYSNLAAAFSKIQEVAKYVDEKKAEHERVAKVLEFQDRIQGKVGVRHNLFPVSCCNHFKNLAVPHRRFVREGDLVIMDKKKQQVKCAAFFFWSLCISRHFSYSTTFFLSLLNCAPILNIHTRF